MTQPLTLLHVVNLHIQIAKQKPLEIRGKILSLKDQWIPSSYIRRNKFSIEWPCNTPEDQIENFEDDQD